MIQFDPPLNSSLTVPVPSTLVPGSRLRLHATLSRDEYVHLREDGTKVQVWSDFNGTWGETSFAEESAGDVHDEDQVDVDFSLTGPESAKGGSQDSVSLVATTPLPPLVGRAVQFTYRLVHASGVVSWLGSEGTNGRITVGRTHDGDDLTAEEWIGDEHGVYSWKAEAGGDPVVIARLGEEADWRGWAIGKEGPSRFTALSSAVTERIALALLPKARTGTYVSYEPMLYHTTADATLSLTDSGEILFHPGDQDSVLHASILTSTWKNSVSDKATALDISTPHFLAVCVQEKPDIGRVHFLPMSDSAAVATVKSTDIRSLVPTSPSLALVSPTPHTTKFLTESLPDKSLRIALGPTGGELLVLPGYSLRGNGIEWVLAFLPEESGSVTAVDTADGLRAGASSSSEESLSEYYHSEESSEHNTIVEAHSRHPSGISNEMLLIVVALVQFILNLVAGSIPPGSSLESAPDKVNERPPGPLIADPPTEPTEQGSKLAFEVTGKYTLVIKGEPLTQLLLTVDGKPLTTTLVEIGGNWLIESDSGGNGHVQLLQVAFKHE